MKPLEGKIALVTGASRGVGRGAAIGLAEAGATVIVTGRTETTGQAAVDLPGTIHETAELARAAGGEAVALRCDHTDDSQTAEVFEQISERFGRLDILVNNVWGGYEFYNDGTEFWLEKGFWTAPIARWDKCFAAGVRAHYVCSVLAAPMMIERKSGLIVNISFSAANKNDAGVSYAAAKAADDRMAGPMAHELRPHGVAAVSLYPGLVRTEGVLKAQQFFDMRNTESPQFIGRVIAGLARDKEIMNKSGGVFYAADLAAEYKILDIDGKSPLSEPKWNAIKDTLPKASTT